MLTVAEAAKEMRVSRQTMLSWINKGIVKATKPLRVYRIEESEIKRLKEGK